MTPAELTMGPVLFHWPADVKRDFWFRVADEAPVSTVYLGEAVCAKREPFFTDHIDAVVSRLERAGKKIVWSSLAQVVTAVDRRASLGVTEFENFEIEANDASVLQKLKGKRHRVGQYVNVYNEAALVHLAGNGAHHFSLQPELPAETVNLLAKTAGNVGATLEVQVFGRVTLALSARCYHARAHHRTKDNCLFVCENDPDGMDLETRAREKFLTINGIQTLSHKYLDLSAELPRLVEMGVSHFRISPHSVDMIAVCDAYRRAIDGIISSAEVSERLEDLGVPMPSMNGFFHRKPGYQNVSVGR